MGDVIHIKSNINKSFKISIRLPDAMQREIIMQQRPSESAIAAACIRFKTYLNLKTPIIEHAMQIVPTIIKNAQNAKRIHSLIIVLTVL